MKCSHDGCQSMDAELYSVSGTDDSTFALCDEHAAAFGFCLLCGAFIGGTEDVFLTGRDGVCFDCFIRERDEMDYVFADDDSYGEDYDDA